MHTRAVRQPGKTGHRVTTSSIIFRTSRTARVAALAALMILVRTGASMAEVKLNPVIADHCVLQRDAAAAVWGTAAPGESVTVTFAGQSQSTTADANGAWIVRLSPMPACAEGRPIEVRGSATASPITINDVLVGDVWLVSGQSNMEFALQKCTGGPEAAASADNPLLRLCTIPHTSAEQPAATAPATWSVSSPKPAGFFPAVGWWFASKLQKDLGIPVGVINATWGGTTIQAWLPTNTLVSGIYPKDKSYDPGTAWADFHQRLESSKPDMEKWQADRAAAAAAKQPEPPKPASFPGEYRGPAGLWNGMIHPILPVALRGVVWYQGENNAYPGIADTYFTLLPSLISEWRNGFARPDLPFIICQISAYRKPAADPNTPSGMALLREAQLQTVQKTPGTVLVVTLDLGEEDVHYKNKEPAGARVRDAALRLVYGNKNTPSSPMPSAFAFEGNRAIISFTETAGSLKSSSGPLSGFLLAGSDKVFHAAEAAIDGDRVIVTSAAVPQPVAVRYAWADFPGATLVNGANLPASTFRSDNWDTNPKTNAQAQH